MAYDYPTSLRDTRIGVESTPGTAVAASVLLPSISITPKVAIEKMAIARAGRAFKKALYVVKEYTEAKAEGAPDFNALAYLFASYFGAPTTTDVGAAGDAIQHVFSLISGAELGKTLTVEHVPGGNGQAFRFAYGVLKSMELGFTRSSSGAEATFSGDMFGHTLDTNATASTATELTFAPILPTYVTLFAADTAAGLDTATALEADFQVSLSFGERYAPAWHIRKDLADFAGVTVKKEQEIKATLKVAADAAGLAWIDTMRSGGKKYLRVQAEGAEIESGYNYLLKIDLPVMVDEVGDFSDEDGIFAVEYTLQAVDDADLGAVCQATLVNVAASV